MKTKLNKIHQKNSDKINNKKVNKCFKLILQPLRNITAKNMLYLCHLLAKTI